MTQRQKSISSKQSAKKKSHSARERVSRASEPISVIAAQQPVLSNAQDNLVVQKLARTKFGDLPIDRFAELIRKEKGVDAQVAIVALRQGLIQVYQEAANLRRSAKASLPQIRSAQAAARSLSAAVERLDHVKPPRQRGLRAIFGSPLNDHKGFDELNTFAATCWQLKLDLAKVGSELERAISVEEKKPSRAGERKKRLRTLVEVVADWWESNVGKPLAPYVYAKRLGKGIPAFVVGRQGDFIELAKALFSSIDEFTESEVISAVTNVHESRLKKRNSK
jgi:hypothetical protein